MPLSCAFPDSRGEATGGKGAERGGLGPVPSTSPAAAARSVPICPPAPLRHHPGLPRAWGFSGCDTPSYSRRSPGGCACWFLPPPWTPRTSPAPGVAPHRGSCPAASSCSQSPGGGPPVSSGGAGDVGHMGHTSSGQRAAPRMALTHCPCTTGDPACLRPRGQCRGWR